MQTLASSWYDLSLRYYYQQLTAREKHLMAELYQSIMAFETSVSVEENEYTLKELQNAYEALNLDCPELFQIDGGYQYTYNDTPEKTIISVNPDYRLSQAQYAQRCSQMRGVLQTIRQDSAFGTTDYSHECAIYRYLISHCQYRIEAGLTEAADGPLVYGYAQCSGYARAFSLLLRCCGIPAFQINGSAGGDHSWTYVNINGNWYQCDVTFDDPVGEQYQPKANEINNYFYLNMPDHLMREHIPQQPRWLTIPSCVSIADNYAYREGVYAVQGTSEAEVRRQVCALYRSGVTGILMILEDDALFARHSALAVDIMNELGVGYTEYPGGETHSVYLIYR